MSVARHTSSRAMSVERITRQAKRLRGEHGDCTRNYGSFILMDRRGLNIRLPVYCTFGRAITLQLKLLQLLERQAAKRLDKTEACGRHTVVPGAAIASSIVSNEEAQPKGSSPHVKKIRVRKSAPADDMVSTMNGQDNSTPSAVSKAPEPHISPPAEANVPAAATERKGICMHMLLPSDRVLDDVPAALAAMLARAPASVREVLEDAKDIHMAWREKVKEEVELGSAKDSGNRNDDQNNASMPPSELPTGGGDRKRRKDSLSTDTPVAAAAAAGSELPDSSAPHSPKGRAIARKPSQGLGAVTLPGRSYVRTGSATQAAAAAAAKGVADGSGSGGGGYSSSSSS
ncbi:unnamed protein product, partial [Pylaiella littoralis]